MIIGYKISVKFRFFGKIELCNAHTIFTKYYLSRKEIERSTNKLWNLEKIPMIEVGYCCIQDSDEKNFPKEVDNIRKLMV